MIVRSIWQIILLIAGWSWLDLTQSANLQATIGPSSTTTLTNQAANIKYNGKLISLNFQNADIRMLLQTIAETAQLNFILSDAISGSMTIHLENLPWDQALDIILTAHGLGYRRFNNVWIIAPIDEITNNELAKLAANQKLEQLLPLSSQIISLKYAKAQDMATLLKTSGNSLLSPRGQVSIDARTNSLLIQDTIHSLQQTKNFINDLDVPAKQVLIEARIVSIDTDYTKDLGVRFGINYSQGLSGRLTGATELDKQLNFNLPAASKFTPGSIALGLINYHGRNVLDLELSALESQRRADVISRPRLVTSNQYPAIIQQGEEIPFQQSTSSGATSVEFKKAVLSLQITPQITPDKNIVLNLKVTQNTRGEQLKVAEQTMLPPAIDTREVESQVFLKDGQTVVIGGIYQRTQANTIARVPFFGELPLIGGLFRNKSHEDLRKELLIFITPKIVERASDINANFTENI